MNTLTVQGGFPLLFFCSDSPWHKLQKRSDGDVTVPLRQPSMMRQ